VWWFGYGLVTGKMNEQKKKLNIFFSRNKLKKNDGKINRRNCMVVKVGALKPAEAKAPATPPKEAEEIINQIGDTPASI
jgi:hypothetical protein